MNAKNKSPERAFDSSAFLPFERASIPAFTRVRALTFLSLLVLNGGAIIGSLFASRFADEDAGIDEARNGGEAGAVLDEGAIRRALVVGTLRAEDPLPSVRELAAELLVNPRTVSQAYQELEREGVIYVRRGLGTFVNPDIHPDRHERRALARGVAKRALLEARHNGLAVEERAGHVAQQGLAMGRRAPQLAMSYPMSHRLFRGVT